MDFRSYGAVGELQQVTRDYARYSRSRGGLGTLLGGCAGLLVFLAVWVFGGGAPIAVLAIGLTALWLVGKEVIRRRYYQRFGLAREAWAGQARRAHRGVLLLVTPLLLAFAVWIVAAGWLSHPAIALPYLIFCLTTPWIVGRYLFTANEIVVGTGLLFVCAVLASGHTPALLGLLCVPAYALAMIPLGWSEHRQFRSLAARLSRRGAW
jgi:hypothetical protein